MRFGSLLLFLLAVGGPALAGGAPLVIADIDDTLKITRVRDPWSLVLSAFDTNRAFVGMPELLNGLAASGAAVAYVSAAPRATNNLHPVFLRQHGFPPGELSLRGAGEDKIEGKLAAIRRVVRERAPSELVLIGDNGEGDPEVFERVMAEFPRLKVRSFVHVPYRRDVLPVRYRKQLWPYATPVEIVRELKVAGLVKTAHVRAVEAAVLEALPGDRAAEEVRSQVFPGWMDCHPALEKFLGGVSKAWREKIRAGCANGRVLSAAQEAGALRGKAHEPSEP